MICCCCINLDIAPTWLWKIKLQKNGYFTSSLPSCFCHFYSIAWVSLTTGSLTVLLANIMMFSSPTYNGGMAVTKIKKLFSSTTA
jgi:hypothetical protein